MRDAKLVHCVLGAHDVAHDSALQRVQGFQKPRKGGGANQIVLRENLDEYACWECVERAKRGISQDQAEMW